MSEDTWRDRLRRAREARGWSLRTVAQMLREEYDCGVHFSSVHQYETGDSTPGPEYLTAFCLLTDVTPTWLLTGQRPQRWSVWFERRKELAADLRRLADRMEGGVHLESHVPSPPEEADETLEGTG